MNSANPATPVQKIGAFFDIDGTLLAGPSLEWRFASWLEAYGALGFWQMARWSVCAISSLLSGDLAGLRRNKAYLAGSPSELVRDWQLSLPPHAIAPFSEGAERIKWHLQQDHRVFLISGTLAPLAEAFAQQLDDRIEWQATNLERMDGRWTGSIVGNHMGGHEKAAALTRIADRCGISLARSFAYGNEIADLPMLESVGHPIAVNPGAHLRRIATQRNWRIARWNSVQPANASTTGALLSPTEAR